MADITPCGALYGTGNPARPTATCGRPLGHAQVAQDGVGHNPTPLPVDRERAAEAEPFVFYPGDRIQVIPTVVPADALVPAFPGPYSGLRGTVASVTFDEVRVWMDVQARPKRPMRFRHTEVQVIVEHVIGPFS